MSGFAFTPENTRMLLNLMIYTADRESEGLYLTDNVYTECAYYPEAEKLVVINNSDKLQTANVKTEKGMKTFELAPYEQQVMDL